MVLEAWSLRSGCVCGLVLVQALLQFAIDDSLWSLTWRDQRGEVSLSWLSKGTSHSTGIHPHDLFDSLSPLKAHLLTPWSGVQGFNIWILEGHKRSVLNTLIYTFLYNRDVNYIDLIRLKHVKVNSYKVLNCLVHSRSLIHFICQFYHHMLWLLFNV